MKNKSQQESKEQIY